MVSTILKKDLALISKIVDKELIQTVEIWFEKWRKESSIQAIKSGEEKEALLLFLSEKLGQLLVELEKIKSSHIEFRKRFAKAVDDREKQEVVIDYATNIIDFKTSIYDEKAALKRWFFDDAIDERFEKISIKLLKHITFLLGRIGIVFQVICKEKSSDELIEYWDSIKIMSTLKPLLNIQTEKEILIETLKAMAVIISSIDHINQNKELFQQQEEKFIYRLSLESHQDVWIQSSALKLLLMISIDAFFEAAKRRFQFPKGGDDIFVRNRLLSFVTQLEIEDNVLQILQLGLEDQSPFVRQGALQSLKEMEFDSKVELIEKLLESEIEDSVKAVALDSLTTVKVESFQILITNFIRKEKRFFPLRYAFDITYTYLVNLNHIEQIEWGLQLLKEAINTKEEIKVRRWAGEYLTKLEAYIYMKKNSGLEELAYSIKNLKDNKSLVISKDIADQEGFYTVLTKMALEDFSLELQIKSSFYKLYKGELVASKMWRFLYESRWTSPDKREAHNHTEGREYRGDFLFPTNKLAEVTPTKVPGEPVHISKHGGWLNFLPLPSHILFAIKRSLKGKRELNILTSEGITTIKAPSNYLKRVKLYIWGVFNFSKIATIRAEVTNDDKEEIAYKAFLNEKEIDITFKPFEGRDSKVSQFFAGGIFFDPQKLVVQLEDYFVSAYENSLLELTFFTLILTSLFIFSHIRKYRKFKKQRGKIPLIIGGWGTRGKSGTERIKAAMFNALGYNIVSKTTGCEAMFLHSRGHTPLKEMFLFRPYDKATIWEQYDLVNLAADMETEIFLWECMGLTPSYIEILQQQWMRDHLSTITNTYPDHENLQGPAGRDIPQVMRNFVPKHSVLITSEEEMTPILEDEAHKKESVFKTVGWREAGKIAPDILERMPYDEHPYNIALVKELGEILGIEGDIALKSMADLVVPDIGVLKTFPVAAYKNREIEFINGMSANERFGTISNWERIGLYDYNLLDHPEVFISTVINNRADRVSRSRVFADIIAFDLNADLHFLIGTNLNGFLVYLKESFHKNSDKLLLFKENTPLQELQELSHRYRLPTSDIEIEKRKEIMERQSQQKIEDDNFNLVNMRKDLELYQKVEKMINDRADNNTIEEVFQKGLLERLLNRIIVIDDPHKTGDEIINIITNYSPVGLKSKIMGLQNIKGAGLDFVYRFLSWEQCYLICQKILSPKKAITLEGITELSRFKEFGPLSFEYVEKLLHNIKGVANTQTEYYQAEIENILNLISTVKESSLNTNRVEKKRGFIHSWFYSTLESFLDAGDAIKRKKEVDKIYKDLVEYKISHQRAAIELKKINKRQKGGWLFQKQP